MNNKSVLLISFYNPKALGVRYLEKALKSEGIPTDIVILKGFNSKKPEEVTQVELELLKDIIKKIKPGLIGLSVMTSFYLDSVYKVNDTLKKNFDIPIVWGGVFPTLFPGKCIEFADYIVMGEGEVPIVKLAKAIFDISDVCAKNHESNERNEPTVKCGEHKNNNNKNKNNNNNTNNNNDEGNYKHYDFHKILDNIENLAYIIKDNNTDKHNNITGNNKIKNYIGENKGEYLETPNYGEHGQTQQTQNSKDRKEIKINKIGLLRQNLDEYGYPELDGRNKYFINDNKLVLDDPLLRTLSYELSTSRGCPFSCSYCSSINLHRLYKGKGSYTRFRTAKNVIEELKEAKKKIKNLKFIHFWDEIFPEDKIWIDKFTTLYKEEINLPFGIWAHPLKLNKILVEKLVYAGLHKVVMGIQSGSVRIRKEIFHRNETQEDIINASKILSECGVERIVYDFILRHPFETQADIIQSFELCTKLHKPFELQLHGLNFLPGTDIVDIAINSGIASAAELEKIMYAPMQEQYTSYWGINDKDKMINFWYSMIYMTQFKFLTPITDLVLMKTQNYQMGVNAKLPFNLLINSKKVLIPIARIKDYYLKLRLIARNI